MQREHRPVLRDSEEGLWKGIRDGVLLSADFSPEGKLRLSKTTSMLLLPRPAVSPPGSRPPLRPTPIKLPSTEASTQTSNDKLKEEFDEVRKKNAKLERQVKAAERLVRLLALYNNDKENL